MNYIVVATVRRAFAYDVTEPACTLAAMELAELLVGPSPKKQLTADRSYGHNRPGYFPQPDARRPASVRPGLDRAYSPPRRIPAHD